MLKVDTSAVYCSTLHTGSIRGAEGGHLLYIVGLYILAVLEVLKVDTSAVYCSTLHTGSIKGAEGGHLCCIL